MGFRIARTYRWPDGKIYYRFAKNQNDKEGKTTKVDDESYDLFRSTVRRSMTMYERMVAGRDPNNVIPIRFIEDKASQQGTYISIGITSGSYGDSDGIALYDKGKNAVRQGCIQFRVSVNFFHCIPHELAHSIGLVHEHEQNNPYDYESYEGPPRLFCIDAWLKPKYKKMATSTDTYIKSQEYDLKAITHYPAIEGVWAWSDERPENELGSQGKSGSGTKTKDKNQKKVSEPKKDPPSMVTFDVSSIVGPAPSEYTLENMHRRADKGLISKSGVGNGRLNYPLNRDVIGGTWALSLHDVKAIIELYDKTKKTEGSDENTNVKS